MNSENHKATKISKGDNSKKLDLVIQGGLSDQRKLGHQKTPAFASFIRGSNAPFVCGVQDSRRLGGSVTTDNEISSQAGDSHPPRSLLVRICRELLEVSSRFRDVTDNELASFINGNRVSHMVDAVALAVQSRTLLDFGSVSRIQPDPNRHVAQRVRDEDTHCSDSEG